MNKNKQQNINEIITNEAEGLKAVLAVDPPKKLTRLYNCKAEIFYTNGFIVLVSCEECVAFYNISNGRLLDILRYAYKYTATSAQHISKFHNWLTESGNVVTEKLRYYEI